MINTIVLLWGLIPLTIGFSFIFRPKRMLSAQVSFRKRVERFEKRLFKAHRATGLAFVLLGLVLILTWFHPVWIYNMFLLARVVAGLFFPQFFRSHGVAQIVPTLWI